MHRNTKFISFERILAIILVIAVIAGLLLFRFTERGLAETTTTVQTGGTPGITWRYTLDGGNATKVYELSMSGINGTITIPDTLDGHPVTSIGGGPGSDSTFTGESDYVTGVVIPSTVTEINGYAFHDMKKFSTIVLPSSVKKIDISAFSGCTSLTSVQVPTTLTTFGDSSFLNCSALTSITIPDSVTYVGDSTFSGCTQLTSVSIPDNISTYYNTFNKVPATIIGTGNTTLYHAPANCSSYTIPSAVNTIAAGAFYNCASLTSVTIPSTVTSMGRQALSSTGITSITIPSSVTSFGMAMFAGCTNLTSVSLPSNTTSIETCEFQNCTALTHVDIPSSVTTIGASAFWNCPGSTTDKIIIPNGITSIGYNAFTNTKGVYYYSGNTVAAQAATAYASTTPWSAIKAAPVAPVVQVSLASSTPAQSNTANLTLTDSGANIASYGVTTTTDSSTVTWNNVSTPSSSVDVAYSVPSNGTYYAWAKDAQGNISSPASFTVSNIDTTPPSVTLSSVTATSADSATVTADVTDTNTVTTYYNKTSDSVAKSNSLLDIAYAADDSLGTEFTKSFTVTSNGTYTVTAVDAANNQSTASIIISNITSSNTPTPTPTPNTNYKVPVIATVEPTVFKVSVPLCLPASVDKSGNVSVADNAYVTNESSYGCIQVTSIDISGNNSWVDKPYSNDFASMTVNSKCFGMILNGKDTSSGSIDISDIPVLNLTKSANLLYNMKVAPQSKGLNSETLGNVVVVIDWYK